MATATATASYAGRHPELTYRRFANKGLRVSEAGFGGYRIDISVQEHRRALEYALTSGINLLDTSANYADGGSERLIGSVLADMVKVGTVGREQIVIVSKAGYLQGANLRLSQERKQAGSPFFERVVFGADLEHCIHPEFLADQLTRSMQRLQVDHIDCLLLHNPEYYLKWANQNRIPARDAQTEYLRRIQMAFQYLEGEVRSGRIGCYGISSNTFPRPATDYEWTNLAAIWEIAQDLSAEHHFRVIEFPCNLFEPGAVTETNQPGGRSLLEYAADKNMTTLINRPLNAIQSDQLIRLAENVYAGEAAKQATAFRERIARLDPSWDVKKLSQLAVRSLRSTAGISSVLVGMRKREYVEDVLLELRQPCKAGDRKKAWAAIAGELSNVK
jgi:aryl-alcohol dehydrogenase-like predicted oxidoreductase